MSRKERPMTFAPILVVLVLGSACSPAEEAAPNYPETRTVDIVENLHGVDVADPYRWLEDLDSPETAAWVEAENQVSFGYLQSLPERSRLLEEITALWNHERFGVPEKVGNRYFFYRNDGLQNQSVLYVSEGLTGTPRPFLDPNTLSADGTIAVSASEVSPDGEHLAYSISTGGSDWREWRVRHVDSGKDLDDRLQWAKFSSASWTLDGKGFYYSRYDEPTGNILEESNYFQKLYYHRLGEPQASDSLIYERPDHKDWGIAGQVTEDGTFLIITLTQGTDTRNRVYYQDLKGSSEVVSLLDDFDANYTFVASEGPLFWFRTDLDAPRGRLIQIDIRRPQPDHWVELVPQNEDTLREVTAVHHTLILSYLRDAHSLIELRDTSGERIGEVKLPSLGTVSGLEGKMNDTETFYSFTSYTQPTTIYRYDLVEGISSVFRAPDLNFDSAPYQTRQVFFPSRDGTRIPMFVTSRSDVEFNGKNPVLLYGYGGFDIALTPSFSIPIAVWLKNGGIYAVANLRGGGEYGEEWHQAGMKLHKQNVFDDFIGAAEWLIDNKYTSPRHLGISGGSNGGLLVGACLTQRPDLFGAAIPAVGVLDMLRFHKFTIGWAWVSDYGSPEDAQEFRALYAYSPYHNIREGTEYPPTLITTADHDDRVVPSHSFKFAARLQAAQRGDNPILIRIQTRAGHGSGKPTTLQIEEAADRLAFLQHHLR